LKVTHRPGGRPSTPKTNHTVVTRVGNKIGYDRRLTGREVANEAGASIGTLSFDFNGRISEKKVAVFAPRQWYPAHSAALSVRAFFASKDIPVVYIPYSPPCDWP